MHNVSRPVNRERKSSKRVVYLRATGKDPNSAKRYCLTTSKIGSRALLRREFGMGRLPSVGSGASMKRSEHRIGSDLNIELEQSRAPEQMPPRAGYPTDTTVHYASVRPPGRGVLGSCRNCRRSTNRRRAILRDEGAAVACRALPEVPCRYSA